MASSSDSALPSVSQEVTEKSDQITSAIAEIPVNTSSINSAVKSILSHDNEEALRCFRRYLKRDREGYELSTVGQYEIIKVIGKQGFHADVKLAKHMPTGKDVAVKIVHKIDLNDYINKTLAREIIFMKILKHPNIVQIFDVIETHKSYCLIMEYCPGGNLADYISMHGRLSENEARVFFRQIVPAVDYCHQKRVLHRDIKADNMLLDSNMNIKLSDFRLSHELDPNKLVYLACGARAYWSPEMHRGEGYGTATDVWSLGVLLYMLLVDFPFDDSSYELLEKEVLRCNYVLSDDLSEACKNLIRKMLVLNPEQRATLKVIMEDEWINTGYENDKLKPYVEP